MKGLMSMVSLLLVFGCAEVSAQDIDQAPTRTKAEVPIGALLDAGRTAFERGSLKLARHTFRKVIEAHKASGAPPRSPSAILAAEAAFQLAEIERHRWAKIEMRGDLKAQEKALKDKLAGSKKLKDLYFAVHAYEAMPWTIAAEIQNALVLADFAEVLKDSDIPFAKGTEEYSIYRTTLFDLAVPLGDQAAAQLEKVLAKAGEAGIESEWTKKGRSALGVLRPASKGDK